MSTSITQSIMLEQLRQEMIADLEQFLTIGRAFDQIAADGIITRKPAWPRCPLGHTPTVFPCYDADVASAASDANREAVSC